MKVFFLLITWTLASLGYCQFSWKGILQEPSLSNASIAYQIVDLQSGITIDQYQSNKSFTPASTFKLLTTALAIQNLGPNYRFETTLSSSSPLHKGDWTGDLILNGNYSPTFSSQVLRRWADSLYTLGVRRIKGRILYPSSLFYNPYPNDYAWGDMGNYYGAGTFPVNFDENKLILQLKPGMEVGDSVELVSMSPFPKLSLTILNRLQTAAIGTGDKVIVYSSPMSNTLLLEGTIPIGGLFTIKAGIPDPGFWAASQLKDFLLENGIEISGVEQFRELPKPITVLFTQYSPPLSELIQTTNKTSNNLYAECIGRALVYKHIGTYTLNGKTIGECLDKTGLDTLGLRYRDASGMSPLNAISPRQFTSLLVYMKDNIDWVQSIPWAGKEGTVAGILQNYPSQARLKSGTMTGVTCYAGYLNARSGSKYALAIMVNHHEGKNKSIQRIIEKYLIQLIENK